MECSHDNNNSSKEHNCWSITASNRDDSRWISRTQCSAVLTLCRVVDSLRLSADQLSEKKIPETISAVCVVTEPSTYAIISDVFRVVFLVSDSTQLCYFRLRTWNFSFAVLVCRYSPLLLHTSSVASIRAPRHHHRFYYFRRGARGEIEQIREVGTLKKNKTPVGYLYKVEKRGKKSHW